MEGLLKRYAAFKVLKWSLENQIPQYGKLAIRENQHVVLQTHF